MLTRAYMPGFRRKLGFGISISIGAVRVAGSSTGATRAMRPGERLAREGIDLDVGGVADVCTLFRSFSTTLTTSRTRLMSTTSTTGAFCDDEGARIDRAARRRSR